MVNLRPFLKTYKEAGSFNSLIAPHAFLDQGVFLTKSNQYGVVFRVRGLDDECFTKETLESYTRRVGSAWRSFDERFRIYQYVVKQLKDFKERKRTNDAGNMTSVARTLSDEDIENLANFIANIS